jgi:hypothetical protein
VERSGRPEPGPDPAWWERGRVPGVAVCLLLIERQLMAVVGTPADQLAALGRIGEAPTDPVTPVIAVVAFVAEALVGYLLALLVLQSLSLLPGVVGRLSGRVVLLVSPRMLHRLLDLLVGGALLAQATLATMPGISPGHGPCAVHHATVPDSTACRGSTPPQAGHGRGLGSAALLAARSDPQAAGGPVEARPSPRRLAVPLPPWLEGGPSNPAPGYTVEQGDTLWDIAASHLAPTERSLSKVARYWQRIYRANRQVVGGDPDLIHPGTRLEIPPPGEGRP